MHDDDVDDDKEEFRGEDEKTNQPPKWGARSTSSEERQINGRRAIIIQHELRAIALGRQKAGKKVGKTASDCTN